MTALSKDGRSLVPSSDEVEHQTGEPLVGDPADRASVHHSSTFEYASEAEALDALIESQPRSDDWVVATFRSRQWVLPPAFLRDVEERSEIANSCPPTPPPAGQEPDVQLQDVETDIDLEVQQPNVQQEVAQQILHQPALAMDDDAMSDSDRTDPDPWWENVDFEQVHLEFARLHSRDVPSHSPERPRINRALDAGHIDNLDVPVSRLSAAQPSLIVRLRVSVPDLQKSSNQTRDASVSTTSTKSDESEEINCLCGATEEDGEEMVCCDGCNTWQHIACLGMSSAEAQSMPFQCDLCDPEGFESRFGSRAFVELQPSGKRKRHDDDDFDEPEDTSQAGSEDLVEPFSEPEDLEDGPLMEEASLLIPESSKKKHKRIALQPDGSEQGEATYVFSASDLKPFEVGGGPAMRNVKGWYKAVGLEGQGLRLSKKVPVTRLRGKLDSILDLLSRPVVSKRDYTVQDQWLSARGSWHFLLKDQANPNGPEVSFGAMDKGSCPDQKEAQKIVRKMCDYVNRMPCNPILLNSGSGRSNTASETIRAAAIAEVESDGTSSVRGVERVPFGTIGFSNPHGSYPRARATLPFISFAEDEAEAETAALGIEAAIQVVKMEVDVPSVAEYERYFGPLSEEFTLPVFAVASLAPQYKQAAKVVRYVWCKLFGSIGTMQDIQRRRDALLQPFLKDPGEGKMLSINLARTRYGPYNGQKLFQVGGLPHRVGVEVMPSAAVKRHVQGNLPLIRVDGKSRTRVAFVLEKLLNTFHRDGNVLEAWRAGCVAADLSNSGAVTSDEIKLQYCQCRDEDCPRTVHVCMSCLGPDVCSKMQTSALGYLLCQFCQPKSDVSEHFGIRSGGYIHLQLRELLSSDATVPSEKVKPLRDQLFAHFEQYRTADDQWQDIYAAVPRPEMAGDDQRPFKISVEGIFPVNVADGRVVYHNHSTNVALTAVWLNRVKKFWLPCVLGLLRLSQDVRHLHQGAAQWEGLIDQFDHLYVRSFDYGFTTKENRLRMLPAHVRKLMEKWTTPVAQVDEARRALRKLHLDGKLGDRDSIHEDWSAARITEIQSLIRQAEDRYKRVVPKGADGAPWFFIVHHMPKNWSWYMLWQLFVARLLRMRVDCNRHWVTQDNAGTLMLEGIIQYLRNGGVDDFFGLPMTPFSRHPLCLSIGHKRHGFQMRTGFTTLRPLSLDDDYDESLNNISFETQMSNLAKWDHTKQACDNILKDLSNVHTQTEYYSVPFECVRLPIGTLATADVTADNSADDAVTDIDCESDNELAEGDI